MKTSLALLVLLLASCTDRGRPASTEPERYARVYARLLIESEKFKVSDSTTTPETYRQTVSSLLKQAGMTEEELTDFMKRLSSSPNELNAFLDLVGKELEQYRTTRSMP